MISIGCDHGGLECKNEVKKYLDEKKISYKDFGCFTSESVDYPEFAYAVAKSVSKKESEFGILCCSTGLGVAIAANKVKGIRAVTVSDTESAKKTREHNNSNVLCLGGMIISKEKALEITDIFLNTEFEGGRHQRRLDLITQIEENNF